MSARYDQLTIFGGNSNPELTHAICAYVDIPPGRIEVFKFSNENIFVRIGESVRENDVFVVQSLSGAVNESIMELLIIIDTLKRSSAGRITAVIPYFGYGRSDKKDQPRVPITARLIADMITVAGANRVLTVDLHAGQLQGFFQVPVDHMTALQMLTGYFRDLNLPDLVVVAPDVGRAKLNQKFAEKVGGDLAILTKERPAHQVAEIGYVIGDVKDRTAVLLDDMIDTAGTLTQAARACAEAGARSVSACATHGVLSGPAIERIEASVLSEVITTDTIPPQPEARGSAKIKQLTVARLLGEAIKRIHHGDSISSLFV
jgi:ribose-phosphate pyrophosphokinase